MGIEVLIPIFGILIVLVPIIGITTVFTIRLGGKPLIETLARELRDANAFGPTGDDPRLGLLTDQVEALTAEIQRLREAHEFDQKLIEGKGGAEPT